MSFLSDLHADPHIRRHLLLLGAVIIALAVAIAAAIGAQWFLRENPPVSGSIVSTSTPTQLTFEEKMRVLDSLQAPSAATSSSGTSSASVTTGTVAPADGHHSQVLDSLSNKNSQAANAGTGSAASGDSGMSAAEKAKILESLQ